MLNCEIHDLRDEAESLIGWWRDAGVDTLIDEQPRDWFAEGNVARTVPAKAHPPTSDNAPQPPAAQSQPELPTVLPQALAEFIAWLATDTSTLANYPIRQRLAPEGHSANAPMIVTDVPERGDAEAGHLLSGEIGALFDRMIAAWKINRGRIYLTALAPARPASGRIDAQALDLLGPLIVHHIRIAAPKKLWLMGEAASRAVLGMNVAEATGRLHFINYDGVTVEAIATLHPRVLLREPKSKGRVWEDMQRLIGDGTA
ncbi:uracil-DNA glycosylase family protein [Sphingomonas sp. SUN039]|uniref:uracil-DNA glycosylase family protein n=1 Tax=Sphingomonas sp. SUN039 TaxID=2937787 RepID=UPI002164A92F|nr:uracil-DNA glycosylase family protein [Sphingomonas sp. SUN039]UVO53882.1 uracil-DNA glycosylase [Sphingomonas sp. SUN039]